MSRWFLGMLSPAWKLFIFTISGVTLERVDKVVQIGEDRKS